MPHTEPIQIPFKEYDTLRAEIIARTGSAYQFITIIATLSAAVLTISASATKSLGQAFWIAASALLILLLIMVLLTFRDMSRLAMRLRELEKAINGKA